MFKRNAKDLKKKVQQMEQQIKELSVDELDQVSGGIITEQGIDWLTDIIRKGKTAGSTKQNVAFLARQSSGKGALAHATGDEAENWVLSNWDLI